MNLSIELERYFISKYIPMPKLFDELNIKYSVTSNMFCPFHYNVHSPSARLYHNLDGWCLYCFSENRIYTSWDIYKKFKPKIDTNKLAKLIISKLPKEQVEKEIENSKYELEVDDIEFIDSLIKFKKHTINYEELVKDIANKIKESN